ncbi:hypothetical protein LWC35_27600 [Pseudonocardia kujensis]|uniref:hypothetical protein n=1 Tax=Pseudonocardia kujensis TaxID=1128675 RepID=UPI001E375DE8|nr:hypothetical protein [Pseudonocardia kujensis]MCE0766641.1 hypothetical protein [Pseudonocardia kujensis]
MPVPDSVIDTLGKLSGVSYVSVLERDSRTILASSGTADSGLSADEMVDAFDSATAVAGPRAGTVRTVVVTGSRVVQLLAPVPLADGAAGVLYLRLVRARANLASALREVEGVTGGRARGASGRTQGAGAAAAALPSSVRTATPSALPGAALPGAAPGSTSTGGFPAAPAPAPPAASPAGSRRSVLAPSPTPRTPPAPALPAAPPATPAALPSAAVLTAPPEPAEAPRSGRPAGAPDAEPERAHSEAAAPATRRPQPREPADGREEVLVSSRSPFLAAEFLAAAQRARPPLPPDPPGASGPGTERAREADRTGTRSRRAERDSRPRPPTERLSAAPASPAPRHRGPGPRPAPDTPAPTTPEAAEDVPDGATATRNGKGVTPGPGDSAPVAPLDPGAAARTAAGRRRDVPERTADGGPRGTGPSPSDDAAAPPADALPRRTGDTVIPPPREPEEAEQERRWATDLHALRRLADGLRRRLR